jgi:hypothetical protein
MDIALGQVRTIDELDPLVAIEPSDHVPSLVVSDGPILERSRRPWTGIRMQQHVCSLVQDVSITARSQRIFNGPASGWGLIWLGTVGGWFGHAGGKTAPFV